MAGKLVLCRHGQSEWNLKNLFTGWVDVDLTEKGVTRKQPKPAGCCGTSTTISTSPIRRCPKTRDPYALDHARRDGPDVDSGHSATGA